MCRTVYCPEEVIVVSKGKEDIGKLVELANDGKFDPSVIPEIDNLQGQITKEVTERTEVDKTLQANIDAETSARIASDQGLQDQISKEVLARTDGDTALQSSVDKEVVARNDADSKLQSSIGAEVDARSKADQSMQKKIDVLEGKNAFSNVMVNGTTIQADSQEDTIELEAGTNIALTTDTAKEKVTIAVTGKVASAAQADNASAADSATKLATARSINGVPFDGSADITISTGIVPIGSIVMWSGSTDTIPIDWALCNGSNGTPNLLDKMVVGAGNTYAVGTTGGEVTHTLTINEIPSHTHSVACYGEYNGSAGGGGRTSTYCGSFNTGATGGGQAHNNMPPYYALAYIMRIA